MFWYEIFPIQKIWVTVNLDKMNKSYEVVGGKEMDIKSKDVFLSFQKKSRHFSLLIDRLSSQ